MHSYVLLAFVTELLTHSECRQHRDMTALAYGRLSPFSIEFGIASDCRPNITTRSVSHGGRVDWYLQCSEMSRDGIIPCRSYCLEKM
jgi:hypothetical protein